mmetsp:Transcript_28580/g.25297  ORF Transcript_28580/g.25297 Transcript_28580/m.25297 type:complete len:98 (+) Transcript_28580:232-525(+)
MGTLSKTKLSVLEKLLNKKYKSSFRREVESKRLEISPKRIKDKYLASSIFVKINTTNKEVKTIRDFKNLDLTTVMDKENIDFKLSYRSPNKLKKRNR